MISPRLTDFAQIIRGFLMGGADIIPGVSGGTVALVLGIYNRLVTGISHFDTHLLSLVKQGKWSEAASYIDLRFLFFLGLGILTGVVSLASAMLYLLTEQRSYILSVFMGLILASSLIVARMIRPQTSSDYWSSGFLAMVAALFAFWLVGLEKFDQLDSLAYFFFCGTVAISAMILPGISGAYILWLLGAYETVADMIHRAPKLNVSFREAQVLLVFVAGCGFGLICFSKLLRWLLAKYHMSTMAVLCGFMIGSLRLMWPFQIDKTPDVEKLKLKNFEPYLPTAWDSEVTACFVLGIAALAGVLLLERWGGVAMHLEEQSGPSSETSNN